MFSYLADAIVEAKGANDSVREAALTSLHTKVSGVYKRIMNSRRTIRWLSGLGIVIGLKKLLMTGKVRRS